MSPARTRVPVGKTETSVETDALFALCTKQTSAPLLFQFGMICVRTFDNMLVFLTAASAKPPRARRSPVRTQKSKGLIFQTSRSPQNWAHLHLPFNRRAHNIQTSARRAGTMRTFDSRGCLMIAADYPKGLNLFD